MLNKNLTQNILTLGCDFENMQGGISQILSNYKGIYEIFNFIPTTVKGSRIDKLVAFLFAYLKLVIVLIFGNYKIIHIHGASYNSFWRKSYIISLVNFFHKKVIYHIHGGGFEEFYKSDPIKIKRVLLKCDVVVVLSEYWKLFFQNEIGCNRVEVIRNMIERPIVFHNNVNDSLLCHFTLLGLLGQNKGVYDLLKVINKNKIYYRGKLKLHLGGDGEIENVNSFIDKYDLSDLVVYEGWVSGKVKQELLSNTNVYILPSYKEGLPLSVIEAMSYSLPIIATPVGGIPELVDCNNGILVDPGNMEQIENAIMFFLNNRKKIRVMGDVSFQKSQKYFSNVIELELVNLYTTFL